MTKRSEKTSPATPASDKRDQVTSNNSLAEVKNLPRWKTVEVFTFEKRGKNNGVGLILDGIPYALWTHVYQNLEMRHTHAISVLGRLEKDKHYITLSKSEIKDIETYCHTALQYHKNATEYHFITDEGYNRAVLEVDTSGMKDRDVAARIEQRKNEMASVFTRFKRGELVQVEPHPVIQKIKEKRDEGTVLSKRVAHLVNQKLVPHYRRLGLNPHSAFSKEHRAINTIATGEHEADKKNKLNSNGLDVQNATKLSETVLLEANILDDETRWGITEKTIDGLYPNRLSEPLKLNERELTLIKRGCTENQRSLFEFKSVKQIGVNHAS